MTHIFESLAVADRLLGEGVNLRTPVRAATTSPGVLGADFANGDTIDGVILVTGDRILIKDQVSSSENGLYIVQSSGAPVRDIDLEDTEPADNLIIWVREGTSNVNTGWVGSGISGTNATFTRYDVSGTLSVERGGTGGTTFTNNAVLVGNGSGAIAEITPSPNSVLVTDGSNVPSLETTLPANLTIPTPTIDGNITFEESTNNLILNVADQTVGTSTLNIPNLEGATDSVITANLSQTLANKDLVDNSTQIVDSADNTIVLSFDVSGTAGTTTSLITNQTANRVINIPDASGTLALLSDITGLDTKESVRLGTTSDLNSNASISGTITYTNNAGASGRGQITATLAASNTFTVDSVGLSSADNGTRILVKDQINADENGIWTTTISGTALTLDRATDFDADGKVSANAFTFIAEGSSLADTGWVLTTNDPITVGGPSGSSLDWAQFSSQGEIFAGDGLVKSGNTLNVVGSTNTMQINANNIQVKSSGTANQILLSSGTTTTEPSWGALPLANNNSVTGVLDETNGGTGQSTYVAGDILYASGANTLARRAVVNNSVLTTNGSGVVDWRNIAHLNTILDPSNPANEILRLTGVASAVNELSIVNAPTGSNPSIEADGANTNVGIDFVSKGTGVFTFGTDSGSSVAQIRLEDNTGGQYVGIDVPAAVATSYTLTLPSANGVTGQVLQLADNSGNLQFSTPVNSRDFHIEDNQIQFGSTNFRRFAFFAWDDSDIGGASTRRLTFYYNSTNRIAEIVVFDEVANSNIASYVAGTDFTNTDGVKTVTFPDIGIDTLLSFRGRKTVGGGNNPRLFGLRLTIV